MMRRTCLLLNALCFVLLAASGAAADDTAVAEPSTAAADAKAAKPPVEYELGEGKLVLPVPAEWRKVKPRNRIIELEFSAPAKKADEGSSRLTVVLSGGSIKANVARWVGQFKNHVPPKEGQVGDVKELTADDMPVHYVDLAGDFQDSPRGPFGPSVEKRGYRMLAAMLESKESGNYFFKLVGPQALVAEQVKDFEKMITGIRAK
ncbi:MAG: hypothetical protein KDA37_15990 [Planctomycetales bacterium]|nr:hypothetical protein [Planctomycetales bacterium]